MNVEAWERQPGEPGKAYAKFTIYRDLGSARSIPKALAKMGKPSANPGYWQTIAARWNWTARCESYDAHVDAEVRKANLQEIVEMNKRQAAIAANVQARLIQTLQSIRWDQVSAIEAARLLDVAVKVERLARGAETARTATEYSGAVRIEPRAMTPEERRKAIVEELMAMGHDEDTAQRLMAAMLGGNEGGLPN